METSAMLCIVLSDDAMQFGKKARTDHFFAMRLSGLCSLRVL